MATPTTSVIAIYPGSFDPITNGHLDLIARLADVRPLIVSILRNDPKQPLFSVEERSEMLREVVHVYPNVRGRFLRRAAGGTRGRACRRPCLLRGIRAISDYEYELQMA